MREKGPLQSPQRPLLVRLFLSCQLLITLARVLLGHGALGTSWTPRGHRVGGGGCICTARGPAGLSLAPTGPARAPVDLCEQAGARCVLLVVLQEQAACLLVEGRLRVRMDQQALDGLWGQGLGQGTRQTQMGPKLAFPSGPILFPDGTLAQLTPTSSPSLLRATCAVPLDQRRRLGLGREGTCLGQ